MSTESEDICPICLSAEFHEVVLRIQDMFDGTTDPLPYVQGEIITRIRRLTAGLPADARSTALRASLSALRDLVESAPHHAPGELAKVKTDFIELLQGLE